MPSHAANRSLSQLRMSCYEPYTIQCHCQYYHMHRWIGLSHSLVSTTNATTQCLLRSLATSSRLLGRRIGFTSSSISSPAYDKHDNSDSTSSIYLASQSQILASFFIPYKIKKIQFLYTVSIENTISTQHMPSIFDCSKSYVHASSQTQIPQLVLVDERAYAKISDSDRVRDIKFSK